MRYTEVIPGSFLSRPNRFIALVDVDGQVEKCHVKNTGRCRELLQSGTRVYLEPSRNPERKTRYSLVTVEKAGELVNLDSQAPNAAVEEWLAADPLGWGIAEICREKTYGESRFDFCLKRKQGADIYLETKGVTLEENGIARFPDAPTERGIKHIRHLIRAREAGYEAVILFVIQMKGVHFFEPNDRTQPDFRLALRDARAAGVQVLAYDCKVSPAGMEIDQEIKVLL